MKEVSHCYENVSLVRVRGCILAAYFVFFVLFFFLSLKLESLLRYLEAVPCDRAATFLHVCAPLRLFAYSRLSACMRVMKELSSPGCRGATGMTQCRGGGCFFCFVFFPPLILFQLSCAGSEVVIASLVHLSVLFPLPQTLPLSSLSPPPLHISTAANQSPSTLHLSLSLHFTFPSLHPLRPVEPLPVRPSGYE